MFKISIIYSTTNLVKNSCQYTLLRESANGHLELDNKYPETFDFDLEDLDYYDADYGQKLSTFNQSLNETIENYENTIKTYVEDIDKTNFLTLDLAGDPSSRDYIADYSEKQFVERIRETEDYEFKFLIIFWISLFAVAVFVWYFTINSYEN